MATLINKQTKEVVTLQVQHTFGRYAAESNTVLILPEASRLHAIIHWNREHWILHDISTNGTYINGVHVGSGSKQRIKQDDIIRFGSPHADSWAVIDADAPQNMLVSLTDSHSNIILEGIVALPSAENPEITLYTSAEGGWICESKTGISNLQSGDRVGTEEATWKFIEAVPTDKTQSLAEDCQVDFPTIKSNFQVSQNEEHVSLKFKVDNLETDLGQRNHHYLVLFLARKRVADKAAGLIDGEQGWIDKSLLSQMVGLNENHINIQIFRFRKQLVDALPQYLSLPQIIEKRRGEIRFACQAVEIKGGREEMSAVQH